MACTCILLTRERGEKEVKEGMKRAFSFAGHGSGGMGGILHSICLVRIGHLARKPAWGLKPSPLGGVQSDNMLIFYPPCLACGSF